MAKHPSLLVGGWPIPLKNDGLRQLGWWHSPYVESHKSHVPNHQPVMGETQHFPSFCGSKNPPDLSLQVSADSGQQPSMKALQREVLAARCFLPTKNVFSWSPTPWTLMVTWSLSENFWSVSGHMELFASNPGGYKGTKPILKP